MSWFITGLVVLASIVVALLSVWIGRPMYIAYHQRHQLDYKYHHVVPTSDSNMTPAKGAEWKDSLFDEPSVYISLIVPAYNEESRLSVMMDETLTYLQERQKADKKYTFEIIIVDDGSRDKTVEVALRYTAKHSLQVVRVLKLEQNQGKGGAVQQGMLHARGRYLLMVDADGASNINDLIKLEEALKKVEKNGHGIAVGSRAHLAERAVAKRKWYRNILMYGFHFAVWILCVKQIKDTQCGFKLFARETARVVFSNQHLRRWCFDVELLRMAESRDYPLAEVAIRWEEIPGSKLSLIDSSFQMARDLLAIRLAFMTGLWRIDDYEELQKKHS